MALDENAPLKSKWLHVSHQQLWFSDKIKEETRLQRSKNGWLKDPTLYTYQAFFNQCRYCSNIIKSEQQRFYIDKTHESRNDFKEIFCLINNLLSSNNQLPLPPTEDLVLLAHTFYDFFTTKIKKIMHALAPDDPMLMNTGYLQKEYETTDNFIDFTATTEEDILKLIKAAPPKSCELDPIPTPILKAHAYVFAPKIPEIVNKSLATRDFTSNIKEAILLPLLKRAGLELQMKTTDQFLTYHTSKKIEWVVCNQLVQYTAKSSNFEQYQLAYRKGHSTKTMLLKVKMDFLDATDNWKVVCLVLLDLSTMFNTVNQSLLLNRLKYRFRVDGTLLN